MRVAAACCISLVALAGPALAEDMVAGRPGVMCASAAALARLTRPDGSSRSAGPGARAEDVRAAQDGGCIPIPDGATVHVLEAYRNTSVVSYDAGDGLGARRLVVPNIDFRSAAEPVIRRDGAAAPAPSLPAPSPPAPSLPAPVPLYVPPPAPPTAGAPLPLHP